MSEADSPGHQAALLARNALEEALFGLSGVTVPFDREGVRDRLLRAVSLTYAVSDSSVLAVAHIQGLTEGAAVVGEVSQMLDAAGDRTAVPSLRAVLEHLRLAGSALRGGSDAVAQIQLARRAELVGGMVSDGPPPPRPFRASHRTPQLFALARPPLLPHVTVEPSEALPEAPPPPPPKPTSFAELAALAARFAEPLAAPQPSTDGAAPEEPAYAVAAPEAEVLRRLARDCLEDIALGRTLRTPNAIEGWRDQAPFEERLLASLDAFATYAGAALPMVALYHAEAAAPDPERAFAVAFVLGCIEGLDTIGAALMTLKQSAPETYPGWCDGFALASSPAVERGMLELASGPRSALAALALDVLYRRGATPADVALGLLASPAPEVARRAARALAWAGPRSEVIVALEEVVARTEDDGLWLAAVESLLVRAHAPARELLRRALVTGAAPGRLAEAAVLLALAGHGSDADLLAERFRAAPSPAFARALGRFGSAAVLGALEVQLGADDEELVAAAAEALERITGAGLFVELEEPWPVDLPPDAEDPELGALPIPTRKRLTNARDPELWRRWLAQHDRKFELKPKWRAGAPFVPALIVAELEDRRTPPERRVEAARELGLLTGLGPFFCDDWVARQEGRLGELAREVAKLGAAPGAWSLAHAVAPPPAEVVAKKMKQGLTMGFVMPDIRGVLPFSAGGGQAPPKAPSAASPAPNEPAGSGTAGPQPSPLAPALPFTRPLEELPREAPPRPASSQPAWVASGHVEDTVPTAPSPLVSRVSSPAPVDLGATVTQAPSPIGAALPFHRGPSGAPTAPREASPPQEGLPFRAPPPSAAPTLSLEQYAALSTELIARPTAMRETLLRYGIADRAVWAEIDGGFRARFAKDPALYARWGELVQQYRLALMKR